MDVLKAISLTFDWMKFFVLDKSQQKLNTSILLMDHGHKLFRGRIMMRH